MDILPSSQNFSAAFARGHAQVVWASLISDLETPISAYLKLAGGQPYSLLLESVVSGTSKDRYSFICLQPDIIWHCERNAVKINRKALHDIKIFAADTQAPLPSLRALLAESRIDLPAGFPPIPISAGLFGYLGYDTVRHIENIPDTRPDTLNLPDGIMMRPSLIAVFDSIENRITLISPVYPQEGVSAEKAYKEAVERINQSVKKLAQPLVPESDTAIDTANLKITEPVSNTTQDQFCKMVVKARDYIHAGDAFQVVLSQRFSVPFKLPPLSLYRALRRLNPSPFLFYLNLDGFQLVGSSPEILVRLREGKITIRPIAGTRPRHQSNRTDSELMQDLLADPKERAEHLMLLDLGRNDVGRVAKVGSVKVTESFNIELYSHVMHIVSNVEGTIDPKCDALDALFAGFPAGTVSGAPKVRAMEIIDELEVARRGPYAGCIGYLGANGALDTCIALRTAIVKDGAMYVQAGGGVVADSDPMYEYNESCAKARALFRAAEEAVRFAQNTKT
jgi:anthranilate synthase component 1